MKRVASYIIALFAVLLPVQAQMGHFYFSESLNRGFVTQVCDADWLYFWVGT